MDINYTKTKDFLLLLEFNISKEIKEENILIIEKENSGIKNLIINIAHPIIIIEQLIFTIEKPNHQVFKSLLKKNRDIVHGAFVLDKTGKKVIFRDTLQLENLDLNEIEGSLNSLSLLLNEYSNQIIAFSKS